jgi:RNA polymerase sigma-B factor
LRHRVVEANLPLVHHLAQRFRGRGEPYDDVVQVGTIGLLNAVDRFDPGKGAFTAFAVPTILGEIRRHFRDRGWALRVPRRVRERAAEVNAARELLTHALDRAPTVDEIARHLGVDAEVVLEAIEVAGCTITVPLPTTPDDGDSTLATVDEGLDLVEHRALLRPVLDLLPQRDRRILRLRFADGLSQSQIAAEVGISQMHVSRRLARSLTTLREALAEEV